MVNALKTIVVPFSTASFNRRKMREDVVGYTDEEAEDVTFRRLMSPESASRDIYGHTPLDIAVCEQASVQYCIPLSCPQVENCVPQVCEVLA
jgi:hypothetical protein